MHDTDNPAARTRRAASASSARDNQHVAAVDDAQIDRVETLLTREGEPFVE